MRVSSNGQREQLVLLFAAVFVLAGGYIGYRIGHSEFSTSTLLGAILAAVIIMGWIAASTVAGCLKTIQASLLELSEKVEKAHDELSRISRTRS